MDPRKVGPPPIKPTSASQRQEGLMSPSGPMIPKPSVALCNATPMISTVARPISPARAETPIARPAAKVCRLMAAATTTAVRRAALDAADKAVVRPQFRRAHDRRRLAAGDPGSGPPRRADPPLHGRDA